MIAGAIATELDPDHLSTPYRVQTNWHVITGAPSSGKSTLIAQLAARGLRTVPEAARQYIEHEVAAGRTVDQLRENPATLQRALTRACLELERDLRPDDVLFLDRAYPDALAWYRLLGLDPNEILSNCYHHRYASVFLLDRCPFKDDGVRFTDDADVGFLDEWHARDYSALGYCVVRVPVLPPEERLAFVLERIPDQEPA